eukprot:805739-Rhodomonas_salina.1
MEGRGMYTGEVIVENAWCGLVIGWLGEGEVLQSAIGTGILAALCTGICNLYEGEQVCFVLDIPRKWWQWTPRHWYGRVCDFISLCDSHTLSLPGYPGTRCAYSGYSGRDICSDAYRPAELWEFYSIAQFNAKMPYRFWQNKSP